MQAQHKEQLDERDRQQGPPPPNPLQAPGVQVMPSAYAGPPGTSPPQGGYPQQVRSPLMCPFLMSSHLPVDLQTGDK